MWGAWELLLPGAWALRICCPSVPNSGHLHLPPSMVGLGAAQVTPNAIPKPRGAQGWPPAWLNPWLNAARRAPGLLLHSCLCHEPGRSRSWRALSTLCRLHRPALASPAWEGAGLGPPAPRCSALTPGSAPAATALTWGRALNPNLLGANGEQHPKPAVILLLAPPSRSLPLHYSPKIHPEPLQLLAGASGVPSAWG